MLPSFRHALFAAAPVSGPWRAAAGRPLDLDPAHSAHALIPRPRSASASGTGTTARLRFVFPAARCPAVMRKPLATLSLLVAWLCANGAIWDAAQLLVWGKMFSDNARVMSVGAALSATFDPAKACELCAGVATAKETAKQQTPAAVERSADKLLLALHAPATPVLSAPPAASWPRAVASVAPARAATVPVPPPRA